MTNSVEAASQEVDLQSTVAFHLRSNGPYSSVCWRERKKERKDETKRDRERAERDRERRKKKKKTEPDGERQKETQIYIYIYIYVPDDTKGRKKTAGVGGRKKTAALKKHPLKRPH